MLKQMQGIELSAYDQVIEIVASSLKLPPHIKSQLLVGKHLKLNVQVIKDFKFKKGDDGSFVYGRMVTYKSQNDQVDIALAMYDLTFKLSPLRIEHKKAKLFLGFFDIGETEVWTDETARSLSMQRDGALRAYFLKQALNEFRRQSGIQQIGGKYCTVGDADCE